jgi:Complex 1 protein (LYR family)
VPQTVPRKMPPTGSRLKNVLPLQVFIRRQQSLSLYRSFIRHGRRLKDVDLRADIIKQIHTEFSQNRTITDLAAIRSLIQEGNRTLEQLKAMASDRPVGKSDCDSSVGIKPSGSSWLDTDDPDDQRGRVGTGWPWGG